MHYHISQNGQNTGPFTKEEVYRRLTTGELRGSDLGWHEGLPAWRPLMELLPPPAAQPVSGAAGPVFATAPQSASFGGVGAAPSQTSTLASASLVCGIVGLFTIGLTALPAIIMGHMALSRIKRSEGAMRGRGLAIGGLVTAYAALAITALAIGSAFMIYRLKGDLDATKQTRALSDIKSIELALMSYESRALQLPTTEQGLRALVEVPRVEPIPSSWRAMMKMVPKDPWGHDYQYRTPAEKSAKNDYDLFSIGPDGVPATEDDIGNW